MFKKFLTSLCTLVDIRQTTSGELTNYEAQGFRLAKTRARIEHVLDHKALFNGFPTGTEQDMRECVLKEDISRKTWLLTCARQSHCHTVIEAVDVKTDSDALDGCAGSQCAGVRCAIATERVTLISVSADECRECRG